MTAQNKVEAVLFASGRAMEEDYIKELTGLKPKEVSKALQTLQEDYEKHKGALFIWNEGTRWKINVREDYSELIKNLASETELARPVMATLALIAYRSPILQSEVIKSRGEGAYAHIAELVDKEFVSKEKFGRSYKLKVAEKFYNYFDVEGDSDIRDAFKDVKPKEVKQQHLGTLDIVQAETDDEADMERQRRQVQLEIYDIKQQREDDKGFLDEFESRLGKVSGNLDVTEKELEEQKNKYQPEHQNSSNESPEESIDKTLEMETSTPNEEEVELQEDEKNDSDIEDDPQESEEKMNRSEEDKKMEDLEPQELASEIDNEIDELTKDDNKKS